MSRITKLVKRKLINHYYINLYTTYNFILLRIKIKNHNIFILNNIFNINMTNLNSKTLKDSMLKYNEIIYKTEELLNTAKNRYTITVQIANRAKRRKYEDIDIIEDPSMKPIIRAILEMADEITQPEIIED
jgi:DNA-directed RNA polymerase subunit omega